MLILHQYLFNSEIVKRFQGKSEICANFLPCSCHFGGFDGSFMLLSVINTKNVRGSVYSSTRRSGHLELLVEPEHWFTRMPSFGVTYELGI